MKQKKMSAFTVISTIILLVLTVLFVFDRSFQIAARYNCHSTSMVA